MNGKTNTMIATVLAAAFLALAGTAAAETATDAVVNINTATSAELSFLPGVGASKAEAIIKYRNNRPFKKVEDIMRVRGIGRKSFVKMRPHLTVNGPTTARKKIRVAR